MKKQDHICICFEEVLNFVFTIVLYMTRLTKQNLNNIYFEEFLNQFNLIYFCICLYL
jgi:hypothetical protein